MPPGDRTTLLIAYLSLWTHKSAEEITAWTLCSNLILHINVTVQNVLQEKTSKFYLFLESLLDACTQR